MGLPENEFGATFWLSAGAVVVGLVSMLAKYAYKSKCENFSLCCGLIKVHRDIQSELKEDLEENKQSEDTSTPKANTTVKIPSLASRLT